LVTNAVLHGKAPLVLALECDQGGLRVRVRDAERMLPRPRQASEDDVSGRGLMLVDRISHAWDVESVEDEHGIGKAIWFELRPSG
jgi:anti-sigma regulatory factor (Ser/Thr protein kinase)